MSSISNVVRQVRDRQGAPPALCRMRLDFPSNDARKPTNVVFDLSLGTDTIGTIAVPAAQMGIPLRYSEARLLRNADYKVPAHLLDYVRDHLPADQPLYLAFDSPNGYLPAVPWEKLATPVLRRPILRLGVNAVRPMLANQTMDVAYCCSLPPNAGISPAVVVSDFVRQLPRQLPELALLHVFTHFDLLIRPLWVQAATAAAVAEDAGALWYNAARPAAVGVPAPIAQLLQKPPP